MKRRHRFPAVSFGLVLAVALLSSSLAIAATPSPTTTELTIFPDNSVDYGSLVALRSSVSSSAGPVSPGVVLFCNADAANCEDLNILGQAQLTSSGSAEVNLRLPIGSHNIRSEFRGTKWNAPSASSIQNLIVDGAYPTVTNVSAVQTGSTFALTGTVFSFGQPPPTGSLAFKDASNGSLPLATSNVDAPTFASHNLPGLAGTGSITSVVVGDFNRDGKFDQIVFDSGTHELVVLWGDGDGRFTIGPRTVVDQSFQYAAVGDFNNDDIPDLAITNGGQTVSFLPGKGNGTFGRPTTISTRRPAGYVSTGDINNDGNADLLVSTDLGTEIWFGNGKLRFSRSAWPSLPQAFSPIRIADLNRDDKADLVYLVSDCAASYNTQTCVAAYLGNGNGTFVEAKRPDVFCGHGCVDVAVADFNGDGSPDLAVATQCDIEGCEIAWEPNGGLYVLGGNGDGTFASYLWWTEYNAATSLSLGDFNGDGKIDICEATAPGDVGPTGGVDLYLGNGSGGFELGPSLPSRLTTLGDFNGDGLTDLSLNNPTSVALSEWETTAVASDVALPGGSGIHKVFGDYEGDSVHALSVSGTIGLQAPAVATQPQP